MSRYFRYTFIAAVLMLCLKSSVVTAQTQDEVIRQLSFSTLSWGASVRDLYYQNASGDPVPLRIPNGAPSVSLEYRGTFPIHFFRIVGNDAEGNPIKERAATYQPGSNEDQLLLFVKDSTSESNNYRIFAVPFAPDSAPDNEYRFLNLSEFPVYVKFGTQQFQIKSRSEEAVVTNIPDSGGQEVAMAIQVSEALSDVRMAYSSSWQIRDGRSALVFITRDLDADEAIDVRTFYF